MRRTTRERPGVVCLKCGNAFTSKLNKEGWTRYCSRSCFLTRVRPPLQKQCRTCRTHFLSDLAGCVIDGRYAYCSKHCSDTRPPMKVLSKDVTYRRSGDRVLFEPRPGYASFYQAEHQVVASRAIGRPLKRGEYVIRINRTMNDNRPENLFVCLSNSEFCRRREGTLPWPAESNLAQLREGGAA